MTKAIPGRPVILPPGLGYRATRFPAGDDQVDARTSAQRIERQADLLGTQKMRSQPGATRIIDHMVAVAVRGVVMTRVQLRRSFARREVHLIGEILIANYWRMS